MDKIVFAGLEINKISIKDLLFNKTMFLAYALLALAIFGIFEVFEVRYFSEAANAHASGMDPTNLQLKKAMKLAVYDLYW
jgi:hypothetical protein